MPAAEVSAVILYYRVWMAVYSAASCGQWEGMHTSISINFLMYEGCWSYSMQSELIMS